MAGRTRRSIVVAVGIVLGSAAAAAAQKRPVVLLHGLASNASTWDATAQRLVADFAVDVYRRDTNWQDSFENQAGEMNASFGGLPASTIAVGHSNGGMVARVWNGSRPFGGLITIATPNQGAPLLANAYFAGRDAVELVDSVSEVFGAANQCPGNCDWLSIWASLADSSAVAASLADYAMAAVLTRVLPIAGPVGGEMLPGSAFLENVNSGAHLGAEQTTPTRVGIVSTAHNWYYGGWMRAVFGEDADWVVATRDAVAIGMDGLGWSILATAPPGDTYSQDLAYSLMDAAWNLNIMDYRWCRNVSQAWYSGWYGLCETSDSIVPTWSQYLPGGIPLEVADGPVHVEETASWNRYGARVYDEIYEVVQQFLNVPPAGTVAPGGGGSGGGPASDGGAGSGGGSGDPGVGDGNSGSGGDGGGDGSGDGGGTGGHGAGAAGPSAMTGEAAIRGCTNYVERSPVFQPDAAHCLEYCRGNGADACEWSESGSCYVEFGEGCYVQGGFSGWYAAVLSHTGNPEVEASALEAEEPVQESRPVGAL